METSDFREMPQEERLRHVQSILARYHAAREKSPYLETYKEAEAGYWYPLLSVLDAALRSGNKKVLDIGTAYGTLLLYSVLWGNEGFGIDMTDAYWSKELEAEYPISWSKTNIEAEAVPWPHTFDVVIFTEVLEHMNYNPVPVFQKIHQCLTPGGLLLISTPWSRHYTPNHCWPDVFALPYYKEGGAFVDAECKYYTIDELVALSLHTGFAIQFLQLYQGHLLAGLVK
ncbi:class I SAM-dependent methyltransferase [Paenibacillus tyrfis]|uniref:class I SAM-dependent methyltransferase n=1 Tax=Paenibacillus tyrfis TaxID=1501230 RepID=UPI00209E63C8|nr:class I SAM-dependent methyltransferase [Paenibacillus tyrfis]MCP1310579.1 class I SAM-dependent methyltransferase [Paenibacillus tyrfis]